VDSLDGIVLCAGQGGAAPFKMASRKRMDDCFEINYFAPVELLRLLFNAKKIKEKASVVFISSIGGTEVFTIGNTIYGATKAALNSTMKSCAISLAPKGIRCNSVMPGMVNTNLIKNGSGSEEQQQTDIQKYPLKRYGEPQDIAYGIIYLLSDAASWVTGHSLVIDGGFTI
jgi:NAD(P)-dependent dehydrogenase (short-subunit alcohol dehydrogenase family)